MVSAGDTEGGVRVTFSLSGVFQLRDRQFVPDALMVATRGADVVRGREFPQTRGPPRDCVGLSLLSVDSPCAGRGVTEAVRASPTAVLRPAGDLCARRRSPRPRCGRW